MCYPRHSSSIEQESRDPAEWQSLHEEDNAHRAFEPFDYESVDRALAASEGRRYVPEGPGEASADHDELECRKGLLRFIYYMLDQPDYDLRLDAAIIGLGSPFGAMQAPEQIAMKHGVPKRVLWARVVDFRDKFPLISKVPETLIRFIAVLINCKNHRLRLEIAVASFNFPSRMGSTFTDRAAKFGISKQAFTKHVLRFQKDFRLPPTREQKSLRAREALRQAAAASVS